MRLTVLGGSAAAPNPGEGCSGYLLETTNTRIVLDLGPGTFPELRRHTDYRTLTAVLISHMHLDHILDLLTLRNALAYNPIPPSARIPLWLPPGGAQLLAALARVFAEPDDVATFFASYFSIDEFEPSNTLAIGNLVVSFTPTVHYVPCWAIRVTQTATSKSLAYTADTGPAADLSRMIEGSQVLLAEATLSSQLRSHGLTKDISPPRMLACSHRVPRSTSWSLPIPLPNMAEIRCRGKRHPFLTNRLLLPRLGR